MEKEKKKLIKKLGKFIPLIGIALFIFLIYDIGFEKIFNAFKLIPIQYYVLAFLPFFPKVILKSYKWLIICKKQKIDIKLSYLIKLSLISLYYANITPGGIGSYLKIFYLKKKSKTSLEKCIVNTLLNNAAGAIVGFLLAFTGSVILIDRVPGLPPVIFAFFVFYTLAFITFMKKSRGNKAFRYLIRPLIPNRYKAKFDKSIDSLYQDIPKIRDLFSPMLIDVILWFINGLQVYFIALAFSIEIPFFIFILISIISVIAVTMLPISFGGLGVREGTFIVLLASYGVANEIAFVISFSAYLVKNLVPGIIGMYFSLKKDFIL